MARSPARPDYVALGAEVDGRLAGWICWGPTPCTLGTYDLYWMAVDPAARAPGSAPLCCGKWNGRLAGSARLIVVETAGRPDYAADPRLLRGPRLSDGVASSPISTPPATIRSST